MKIALAPLAALLVFTSTLVSAADETKSPGTVCKADAEKLCPGVQPGQGRIAACLMKNEAKVSPACKEAMTKARSQGAPAPAPSPKN